LNFSYIDVAIKLALGLLSLIVVINYTGKGNLAPTSASDQIQNYVLGGILGGVIYNPSITILQYCIILLIWFALVLSLRWVKTNNHQVKKLIDGEPLQLIRHGKIDVENVRLAGLTAQEVAFKLRSQGVFSIRDVKSAILDGNLVVIVSDLKLSHFMETNQIIRNLLNPYKDMIKEVSVRKGELNNA